jgi:DNA integrity scanning protein DisA with diadenylate cyclase activity
MKVQDLLHIIGLGVAFYLQSKLINNWSSNQIESLLNMVSIAYALFILVYPLQYYLKNNEIRTLVEQAWVNKALYGFFGLILFMTLAF